MGYASKEKSHFENLCGLFAERKTAGKIPVMAARYP